MKRLLLACAVVGGTSLGGCGAGDDGTSADATTVVASTSPLSTSPASTAADPAVAATDTTVGLVAPSTLVPAGGDLGDPASWIGHAFMESNMAAPFPTVALDGAETGWVSALVPCGST